MARKMQRGQLWTGDFVLSLLLFMVASVLAFTIIYNTLGQDAYNDVRLEAVGAATLLSQEGYPTHWTSTTVIRPGLMSNDRLSLRKVTELAGVDTARLRNILRLTDQFYIYFTNQSNDTVALLGCGVGDISVTATPRNVSLSAIAISHVTTLTSLLNISTDASDNVYSNLSQDFVLIEGNMTSNISKQQLGLLVGQASQSGMIFVIVGNPGVQILGLNINASNVTNASVQASAGVQLGFQTNEQLNISATNLLLSTLDAPTDNAVTSYTQVVVANNSKAVYATWVYNDARVWYIATTNGILQNGSTILPTLAKAVDAMHIVQQPICGNAAPPATAKQVSFYTRTFTYHQQLLTMHLLTWRTR